MLKRLRALVFLPVLLMAMSSPVSAAESKAFAPYEGYDYNSYEESVPAPVGYLPSRLITGDTIGAGALNAPQDMCFSSDNQLYLLDSGNGRILILDKELKLVKTITSFRNGQEELTFAGAKGLFICDDGTLLVADTENHRILITDKNGQVTRILTKPDSELLDPSNPFEVNKVMRDANGIIYALVNGVNDGALTFKPDGSFGGFFASNDVERTSEVILSYIWSKFMTAEQIRNSKSRTPIEFTNFDIDTKGFIYTVTASLKNQGNVRKLNFKGNNILKAEGFGDYEWDRKLRESNYTSMVDIDVDSDGYMTMVDSKRGRIFQYTEEGQLVTEFGGLGDQFGTFKSPVAVESQGERVYVLDNLMNAVTVFESTPYVTTMRTAFDLYRKGNYSDSLTYWNKVLEYNGNSEWAYYGIGRAMDENEQYSGALPYFKLSYSQRSYSDAFREVRKDFIRKNFVWLLLTAVAALAGILLGLRALVKRYKRKNLYTKSVLETTVTYPLYTAIHPLDGFEELKRSSRWSVPLSVGILAVLFFTFCAQYFLTGFTFNQNRAADFNVLITFTQAFLVLIVWAISNWAVCTLIEGKGRFKDIFSMSCYALVPFIFFTILTILLSNILTFEESAFLTFCHQFGLIWSAVLLFAGLSRIHQFSVKKTVASVFLTIVGIAIIVFLAIMFFGLMQQLISFIKSIYSEILLML